MNHRFFNWLYARWNGYYWAACPCCGQMYGGHEAARDGGVWVTGGGSKSVCADCNDSAALHRINIERFERGLVCDAPVLVEPTDYRDRFYTRRPGELLCPSCQSLLTHAKGRLAELTR